ncbi:MAG: ATP-binding protein [Cyanobacteria bacterium Co-bin8]|nr:ATP-binding protein [Cyanobacteria bacterium Co-bin8]
MTNSSPASQPPGQPPQPNNAGQSLNLLLRHLRLPHMRHHWPALEQQATQHHWSYAQFLLALCELEADHRAQGRIKRALLEAKLPTGKSFSSFHFDHCPEFNPAPLMQLAQDTTWLSKAENLLIFGPSGTGKTHIAAALGRCAIELGKRVKFFAATTLVQHLQKAKLDLLLPQALSKLDRFDLLILDDLGYVKKTDAETSVLFELIAHRYERRSLLITANQPFSQWDEVFSDSMMTVAAVDRLVHHALIVEIQAESFRKQQALKRSQA